MRASKRVVGIAGTALAAVVAGGFAAPILSTDEPAAAAGTASIDPSEFAAPGMEYRPGVRWWWPGNGATEQALIEQLEYLHEEGFGAVEIAPFSKAFWTDAETSSLNPGTSTTRSEPATTTSRSSATRVPSTSTSSKPWSSVRTIWASRST